MLLMSMTLSVERTKDRVVARFDVDTVRKSMGRRYALAVLTLLAIATSLGIYSQRLPPIPGAMPAALMAAVLAFGLLLVACGLWWTAARAWRRQSQMEPVWEVDVRRRTLRIGHAVLLLGPRAEMGVPLRLWWGRWAWDSSAEMRGKSSYPALFLLDHDRDPAPLRILSEVEAFHAHATELIKAIELITPVEWVHDYLGRTRHCGRCRYDLSGIVADVCPECGTPALVRGGV